VAEPWDTLRTICTPAFAILAGGAVFKLLFSGRIDDLKTGGRDAIKAANEERDRAIEDRNRALDDLANERASHDKLKSHWKSSVIAQREARRLEEVITVGAPSVPPLSNEEPTGRYYVDEDADQDWRRRSEERRAALARERDGLTKDYVSDMTTTPPDPVRALPTPRIKPRPR
jgi:hypothetical protein